MTKKAATHPVAPDGPITARGWLLLLVLWLLSAGCLAVFAYFLYLTTGELLRLHGILSTFRPAQAEAISAASAPELRQGRPEGSFEFLKRAVLGPDHEAWVSYAYEVDGARFVSGTEKPKEGDRKAPFLRVPGAWSGQVGLPNLSGRRSLAGAEAWARAVVAAHGPGEECTAYYDPENPSRSFLLREPDFSPYLGLLIALAFSCTFAAVALSPLLWVLEWALWALGRWSEEARWPALLWVCLWAAAYLIGGGMVLGHYFFYSDNPFGRSLAPLAGALVYVLPPAALWYYLLAPQFGFGRATPPPTTGAKNSTEEKRERRKQERQAKKRNRPHGK